MDLLILNIFPLDKFVCQLVLIHRVQALKHATQQSFILQAMKNVGLLVDNRCYIELGAGQGGLTEVFV